MAHLAHPHITHPQAALHRALSTVPRRMMALAALAAIAVTVALSVVLIGGTEELTVEPAVPSSPSSYNTQDGTRFDGGPEEGTRGVIVVPAPSSYSTQDGIRFDGGPDEGTAGR
jgi:hypothetical protein